LLRTRYYDTFNRLWCTLKGGRLLFSLLSTRVLRSHDYNTRAEVHCCQLVFSFFIKLGVCMWTISTAEQVEIINKMFTLKTSIVGDYVVLSAKCMCYVAPHRVVAPPASSAVSKDLTRRTA